MKVSVDAAGRLVIPKSLRHAAGITAGTPLLARYRDGCIVIEPMALAVEVEERHGVMVAMAAEGVPTLHADDVNATIDEIRRERG